MEKYKRRRPLFFLSSTLFAMQEFWKEKFARPTTEQTAL
jgi:hypothetical protein